jgi:hypothetical protein
MALEVIAVPPQEHAAWLAAQAAPSVDPTSEEGWLGKRLFLSSGCGPATPSEAHRPRAASGPT